MAKLAAFTEAQQLALDDVIVEFRAASPPEATAAAQKKPSMITAGADPDVIMADLEMVGDVSQVKKGTEPHNGTCPYTQECETRRRHLSTYRPGHLCHWQCWGDWERCPIYKNGGAK